MRGRSRKKGRKDRERVGQQVIYLITEVKLDDETQATHV